MDKIIIIAGIMASGKSTVADLLSREFQKSVHLRGDTFRKMIVNGRSEMSLSAGDEAVAQLLLRHKITADAAKAYSDFGFTVIVQDSFIGQALSYFLDCLAPNDFFLTVLNPTPWEITLREKKRKKKGYTGFSVGELHKAFLAQTPKIGFWLDNSSLTPEETVQKIKSAYLESL